MKYGTNPCRPERGFSLSEFETRTQRAQALLAEQNLDAMLLTTEPNVRYFTGFDSQFWQSPTRPWFVVVPAKGKPVAVVPEIGVVGMSATWLDDVRTWPAPRPADDGITLLTQTIKELCKSNKRLGIPLGHESLLRMPAGDFAKLRQGLEGIELVDSSSLLRQLRNVKSQEEIAKIHYICQLASETYEALPKLLEAGLSERENCQKMRIDLLQRGADDSPFLIATSDQGGYADIIMGPTDKIVVDGDVLIIDTGTLYNGYFCDFDRNFGFGTISDECLKAYEVVYDATEAGLALARPGVTMAELCNTMWKVMEDGGALSNDVGRMGHGLGMQLTEGPSITPEDMTELEPGMVITLEPGMTFAPNKQMVHEENIVITEDGAELLTKRAPKELPIIDV